MPKKKKRGFQKKKKDDSPGDASDCESLERLPSSKKVAAASSTSQLEDEVDQISSFTRISLNSSKSESGETAGLSSSHFFCNYCEFSAESKSVLLGHTRQHMIKCPHCSFSSLSRIEVSRHCKHEHEEDPEGVSQEVGSSSADCEMDKDPCTACVFCSFLTYSTEHLEKHTLHKHPGMLAKSVARMITKQSSTEVRRDDALFYLSISNEGLGKSSNLMAPENSSSPIVIDPVVSKSEDVKPEIKCSYTKSVSILQRTGRLPVEHKFENNRCDALTGDKLANRNTPAKAESSGVPMLVKVESLYCLTCPYSSAYIEKLKCHTLAQHPVGPAVATYNTNCVDAEDIVFFCVREDCSHTSSDSMSHQKHLMNCCSCQQTMKVLEKERLKSTVTYILEHQKKHHLSAADGFFDFASLFLDVCLPPSLTGISSSASENQSVSQKRAERSINMPQNSAMYTAKASVDNSALDTGLYRAPSHLSSTTVSSSGSPSTESNSSKSSQMFFPQQVQSVTQNIQAAANSAGDLQNQMAHHSVMLPTQADCFPRNLSADGRSLQPVQNYSVAFYPQSQGNCPQPASANLQTASASSLLASYPDTPQVTAGWQTGQVQATGLPSAPVQSEQNYRNTFLTQNSDANMTGLRTQNSTTYNPLSQSRTDTFSVEQDHEMNQSFRPAASHSYAPSPGHFSQPPVSGSHLHINNTNSSFPGQSSETSTSNISNVLMTSGVNTVSNSMTSNVFYGQQNPVSSVLNTIDIDQSSVGTQSPPKMVDLLSDSYSILLSDEFGPDGQVQQVNDNNSFIQTPHMPVCPPPYQSEATLSTHNQAQVSQSSVPQGQPISYQAMQHEGSRFQPLAVDDSQMPASGNQFSYSASNQNNQISMADSTGQNPGFQTVQNPSNYGALQNALSQNSKNYGALQSSFPSEESPNAQPAPFQSSEVPNFLVSPGAPSSHMRPVQPHPANSFNNRQPGAGQTAVGHPGTFTPPKNSQPGNKFASPSPLSPSIYLSGQVPRHRRSNWTDADMSPRGMMMSGASPRHVHPPVSAPGSHSFMSQRQSVPGRRGYARGPRMSSGRGRMPIPRMPYNQTGGGGDDDDVILTAVVRGTPPKKQQTHQQPVGRGAYRGTPSPAPRGRGQVLPIQNRQRNLNSAPRVPYPVAIPPPQTHKHFDISKHFEDLACVVNASADDADGVGDDIQIVAVTPGKDKDKMNQPKAVDASKFSFCCVHCGKDQGSKTVMKQHMKARHNDSLLGAFTNTETGQLLFFCPQQACEFMTYDEKRLSEHLSKCFDLDRSKPFDFGTAIKNLKSLKIRQLDVRTMGRSQEFAIDLDGQGMKDNFSSSLNDAFGDIVVNASGRHMLRNAPPHQARLSQQQFQSALPPSATTGSKSPVRHLPPSNLAPRLGNPRFIQPGHIGNRMHRPMVSPRYAKQPSYEMRPQLRQTGPMDVRNIRDMRPRAPNSAVQRQPMRAAPPYNIMTPRMPSRSQQEPVIVIDVDSPERPEEGQESMIIDSPENIHQLPLVSSDQFPSSGLLGARPENINSYPEMMNVDSCPEQQPVSDNAGLVPGYQASASPNLSPSSIQALDSRLSDRAHASHSDSLVDQSVHYSYDGSNSVDEAPESEEDHLQQDSVSLSGMLTRKSNSAALSSSQEEEPISDCDPDRPAVDSHASVADRVMGTSKEYASTASYVETSDVQSHAADSPHGIQTYPSSSSSTPIPPIDSHLSIEPTEECLDEEEKVNALVLEKVFAKVPNMPKNLSRRLVAKFKEYAKHRGVKITTDSKVIDEFVSKIYYKGSAGDKAANRPQPPPDAPQFQPAESPHVPTSAPLAPPVSNSSIPSSGNTQPPQRDDDYESPKDYRDCNTDTVQEDLLPKEYAHKEPAAAEDPSFSEQSSASDVVATHVILAEKTLHFSPTFASIAMKSSVASTKILETLHCVGRKQKTIETNQQRPAELSDSLLKSHVDNESSTVVNRRNSLSDWPLPASVAMASLRRSGSLPQIAFPASPGAVRLPLEHIQEDSTTEASSAPVLSADVSESSEDRPAVPPEGDVDVSESSEDREVPPEGDVDVNECSEDREVPPEGDVDVNECSEDREVVPPEGDVDVSESSEDREVPPEGDVDVSESSEDREVPPEGDVDVSESSEDREVPPEGDVDVNECSEDREVVPPEGDVDVNECSEDREVPPEGDVDVSESSEDRPAVPPEGDVDVSESSEDRQAIPPEDFEANAFEPAAATGEEHKLLITLKEKLKEEVEVSFPPAPEAETVPILISSSVADIVSGHPSLEVDIAGKPLKQEFLDEDNRDVGEDNQDVGETGEVKDNVVSKTGCDRSPKEDMFEKLTPKSSNFIDRKTGQLLLKKTKRGRPRKLFAEKEEPRKLSASKVKPRKLSLETEKPSKRSAETEMPGKKSAETEMPGKMSVETEKPGNLFAQKEEKQHEEEIKDFEAEEEHIVRRSSRSRKPVNKDYRSDANEIDELMSDDDDEYLMSEDDYDTDTDGDWRGGDSDQPPKKRIKKVRPPPDPTAFDVSTRGKFKCWLCKKVFSRCTFAKSHLVQKHKEGLCAVYVDKSEESKSLCLMVFCPRKCRYVTLDLEGLKNHVENCAETELEADGKPYLEINKGFLDNKYTELQGMSLEAVMSIPKARKPKDPTKSPKVKKSVNKSSATGPVIIHHSEASVTIKVESDIPSTAPSLFSSSSPMDTSPVTQQTVTSPHSHTGAHWLADPPPAIRSSTASDQCTLITSKKNCFLPQKPSQYSSPQLPGQQSSSVAIDITSTHFHPAKGSPFSSAAPAPHKHPPGQQIFISSAQIKVSGSSFPQSAVPRISNTGFSASQQVKGDISFPQSAIPRMSNIGLSALQQVKGDSSFPHSSIPRMSNIGFSASQQVKSDSSFPHSAVPRMSNIGFSASEHIKTGSPFPQPASPRVSDTSFSMSEHVKGSSFSPQRGPSRMSNNTGFSASEQIKTGSSFPQPAFPRVSNTGFSMSEQVKSDSSFPQHGPPRMSNIGFRTSDQVKGDSSFPQPGPPRVSNTGFRTSEQVKGDSSFLHSCPPTVSDTSFNTDQEDDIVYMIEDNGTICLK